MASPTRHYASSTPRSMCYTMTTPESRVEKTSTHVLLPPTNSFTPTHMRDRQHTTPLTTLSFSILPPTLDRCLLGGLPLICGFYCTPAVLVPDQEWSACRCLLLAWIKREFYDAYHITGSYGWAHVGLLLTGRGDRIVDMKWRNSTTTI